MAVVIGDIHGDMKMAQAFLDYKPCSEHVALGDYVDSRDPKVSFADELACLDLLIQSSAILIWGNHDLAYMPEWPWEIYHRFELSKDANGVLYRDIFASRYCAARNKGRFKAAYAADGWLCTHAGISTSLTASLPDAPWESGDPTAIAKWLNVEFNRELSVKQHGTDRKTVAFGAGPLFQICRMRGGTDLFGGIFWYDPRWESSYPDPRLKQIFGHTQTEGPMRKGKWINIHIEDGYWIFDTEIDDFVRLRQ